MKPSTARLVLGLAGMVLLLGFFLPWVDWGGSFRSSGYAFVNATPGWTRHDLMLAFVPLSGATLVAMAVLGASAIRRVSIVTGLLVLGYPLYKLAEAFFRTSGWGLWLVFAAAFTAVIVPFATRWDRPRS